MSFIAENYIWFIIAGFVLLMIIIGYYAEKTNFGKKKSDESDFNDNNELPKISDEKKRLLDVTSASQIVGSEPIANMAVPEVVVNNQVIPETEYQSTDVFAISNSQVVNYEAPMQIPNAVLTKDNTVDNDVNLSNDDVWKF